MPEPRRKRPPSESWRNRIVGSGDEPPGQLLANPRNWRTHPASQRDALRGSLSEIGWVQQILVNRQTGHVVDGHARVEEALTQGEPSVPVLYVDLTPEEEGLVLATLDPIGAMATRDDERLLELLSTLSTDDPGLAALLAELAPLKPTVGLTDPDDVPELGDDSGIKAGDLFALGDHRLMCGDATKSDDVTRLMDGAKADATVTDPPYNVGLDYGSKTDDRKDSEAFWEWQRKWFAVAVSVSDRQIVTPGCVNLEGWIKDFAPKHVCVWDKGEGANTHGRVTKYWAWEPIMCHGSFERSRHTDVFRISALGANPGHPCPKPIGLWSDMVTSFTRGSLYDPFVGSGTTIIAAEQLDRRCYAMEIDPRYVAVAIKRWEDFTGRNAEQLP
jgi:hypothetical protein